MKVYCAPHHSFSSMDGSVPRRRRRLRAHLTSSSTSRANVRPGDEDREDVETSFFFSGAFRPRTDEATVVFPLTDDVPDDLVGAFLRIGPNPAFDFTGKPYHVFDGDGMVHAVSFPPVGATGARREATYANRWVRTRALRKDDAQGFSFSIMGEASQIGQTQSLAWVPFARDLADAGRANTSLVWHAPSQRLLALFEQDKPYALDPSTLEPSGVWMLSRAATPAPAQRAPTATFTVSSPFPPLLRTPKFAPSLAIWYTLATSTARARGRGATTESSTGRQVRLPWRFP